MKTFDVKKGISIENKIGFYYSDINPSIIGYNAPINSTLYSSLGIYKKIGLLDTDWTIESNQSLGKYVICKQDGTKVSYSSISSAITNAVSGDSILLFSNITQTLNLKNNVNIIGNGFDIIVTGQTAISAIGIINCKIIGIGNINSDNKIIDFDVDSSSIQIMCNNITSSYANKSIIVQNTNNLNLNYVSLICNDIDLSFGGISIKDSNLNLRCNNITSSGTNEYIIEVLSNSDIVDISLNNISTTNNLFYIKDVSQFRFNGKHITGENIHIENTYDSYVSVDILNSNNVNIINSDINSVFNFNCKIAYINTILNDSIGNINILDSIISSDINTIVNNVISKLRLKNCVLISNGTYSIESTLLMTVVLFGILTCSKDSSGIQFTSGDFVLDNTISI